jgi:serine/threonine protein kinase
MLSGLIHINKAGYSHLNIKCEILLLDAGLNVKISDFSFARQNSLGINIDVGSEFHRAPEICRGLFPFDGEKADVFSLSIVLFAMVMKRFPTARTHNVIDAPEY